MTKSKKLFDYWDEMLTTHRENGYLVVLAVLLLTLNTLLLIGHVGWPADDVYYIPGVEQTGKAGIAWSAPMPERAAATITEAGSVQQIEFVELPLALPVDNNKLPLSNKAQGDDIGIGSPEKNGAGGATINSDASTPIMNGGVK